MMCALAFQAVAEHGAEAEGIARRFGVDWPHLLAQIVSFGIVCAVLYLLAYKPILKMLEARRQQIASGLANAKKIEAELARIEVERRDVLNKADAYGKQLIEEARAAAARVRTEETRKASAAAEQMLVRAQETTERERALMLADLKREVGQLVLRTTASVTGKVLTTDDQRRLAEETAAAAGMTPMKVQPADHPRGAAALPPVPDRRALDEAPRAAGRAAARRVQAPRLDRRALELARLVRLDRDRHTALVESAAPPRRRSARRRRRPASRVSTDRAWRRRSREPRPDRRDAHPGRQRRLRRQRARTPRRASGHACSSGHCRGNHHG